MARIIPKISPQEYQAFRSRFNDDFPNTYDEWLKLPNKQVKDALKEGGKIRHIEVHADGFARYCRTTGASANVESLTIYAGEKAAGNCD